MELIAARARVQKHGETRGEKDILALRGSLIDCSILLKSSPEGRKELGEIL